MGREGCKSSFRSTLKLFQYCKLRKRGHKHFLELANSVLNLKIFLFLFCVQPKMTKHTDNFFLTTIHHVSSWNSGTHLLQNSVQAQWITSQLLLSWNFGSWWLGATKDTPIETMRFMLDLPPMQTRQKVEQVKAYIICKYIFHCHQKSPQATPCPSRGLHTANMPVDRAQANQGVGKVPKPILASLWLSTRHCCQKCEKTNWENTVKNGQQAKLSQRSSFSFKKTANHRISYTTYLRPQISGSCRWF